MRSSGCNVKLNLNKDSKYYKLYCILSKKCNGVVVYFKIVLTACILLQ